MSQGRRDFLTTSLSAGVLALFPLEAFAARSPLSDNQSFPSDAEIMDRQRVLQERQQLMDFFSKWFPNSVFGKSFSAVASSVDAKTMNEMKMAILTAAFDRIEHGQSGLAFLTRPMEVESAILVLLAGQTEAREKSLRALIETLAKGADEYMRIHEK